MAKCPEQNQEGSMFWLKVIHGSIMVGKDGNKAAHLRVARKQTEGGKRVGAALLGFLLFLFTPSGPQLIFGWHCSHLRQISPPLVNSLRSTFTDTQGCALSISWVLFNQIKLTRLMIMAKGDGPADKGVCHQPDDLRVIPGIVQWK